MSGEELDLALGLLDHQIVDSDGRHCGKVDDVELEGKPGERLEVAAIVVGPGAWRARLRGPLGRLAARLGGGKTVRVPWEAVDTIEASVVLSKPAGELRLGRGDDRARGLVERIPGS